MRAKITLDFFLIFYFFVNILRKKHFDTLTEMLLNFLCKIYIRTSVEQTADNDVQGIIVVQSPDKQTVTKIRRDGFSRNDCQYK